ncbi:MAG: glycosyltransferase family 2 protein, partial [Nanoarchaeota archaeon]|nr:glycosyltransferase family 2 protein [Nanoarchaeota archaeon]
MPTETCIITYDDMGNLDRLLNTIAAQVLSEVIVDEVIIISTEKFRKGIKNIASGYPFQFRYFFEKERTGKYNAVNIFFSLAASEVLVLCSGDIFLEKDAIECICLPLKNEKTGVVAAHPIPRCLPDTPLGYTISSLWKLHHQVSLSSPKFGEMIALRNLKLILPSTGADEEMIAYLITSQGYGKEYASKSIVYNYGARTVSDFIKQRRRIYCSHLLLRKNCRYTASTMDTFHLLSLFAADATIDKGKFLHMICCVFLEGSSRILGYFDYLAGKDYTVWPILQKDTFLDSSALE